jgi:uncharacterized protein (TIGR00255 family)
MTGFARVRRTTSEGEFVLSVKSVNHRGLDLHFHLPPELDAFETGLRNTVKKHVARGHLQIHVSFIPSGELTNGLNEPLLAAYMAAFRKASQHYGLPCQPDLNAAFRIPTMFRGETKAEVGHETEEALVDAMREALEILNRFREREGKAIAEELRGRCSTIEENVGKMEDIRSKATAEFQKRLKERLKNLLRGAGIEPQRLAQEAALLADRSDISEELMRLKTHAGQLQVLLDATGEAGKKLDFLLQEMNRETNTILSKTSGLGDLGLTITDLALVCKAEVDKIREQSLNLE